MFVAFQRLVGARSQGKPGGKTPREKRETRPLSDRLFTLDLNSIRIKSVTLLSQQTKRSVRLLQGRARMKNEKNSSCQKSFFSKRVLTFTRTVQPRLSSAVDTWNKPFIAPFHAPEVFQTGAAQGSFPCAAAQWPFVLYHDGGAWSVSRVFDV